MGCIRHAAEALDSPQPERPRPVPELTPHGTGPGVRGPFPGRSLLLNGERNGPFEGHVSPLGPERVERCSEGALEIDA
jgi:hypothetical protein